MTVQIAYALFAVLSFPPTTTMADMEALGKKFTCGRCTKKGALKWTELVEHFHQETVIHEVCAPYGSFLPFYGSRCLLLSIQDSFRPP
ncbi:hypothetical protein DFH11DRAFT_1653588 [Phellopilus nigrolimitatus]|nr:hypothetical protein DFH11DRAFT_1653588 [Phellopilus nigrolimitatus]